MPNIASVLKEEIARVARKEIRGETEQLKKASAQYRSEIAALKRRVTALEQHLNRQGKAKAAAAAAAPATDPVTLARYSAKGLIAQRQRLGLSGPEMAHLLGVSVQTVYNWEAGKSRPRQQQMAAIAAVRSMGRRQAAAKLGELSA